MGFYGKVYKQLTKSFKGFRLGNNNKKGSQFLEDLFSKIKVDVDEGIPSGAQHINLDADIQGDEGTICTGNRWLQITDHRYDASTGLMSYTPKSNYCEIWHAPAGGDNPKDFYPIGNIILDPKNDKISEEDKESLENATQLEFGSALIFSTLQYDEAGHVLPTQGKQTYLFPTSPGVELFEQISDDVDYLNEVVLEGYTNIDEITGDETTHPSLKDQVEDFATHIEDIENLKDVVIDGVIVKDDDGVIISSEPSLVAKTDSLELFQRKVGDPASISFWFSGAESVADKQNLCKFIGQPSKLNSKKNAYEISITESIGDMANYKNSLVDTIGDVQKISGSVVDAVLQVQTDLNGLRFNIQTLNEGFLGTSVQDNIYENGVATMVSQGHTVYALLNRIEALEKEVAALKNQ